MKKKFIMWCTLGAMIIGALSGCTNAAEPDEAPASPTAPAALEEKDSTSTELTPITLNEVAHSIFYAPQYVAFEKGYFAEEGLDLEIVTGFGVI